MRNTVEYPITKEEIAECLERLSLQFQTEGHIGDMRPLLLEKAKEAVLTGEFDPT